MFSYVPGPRHLAIVIIMRRIGFIVCVVVQDTETLLRIKPGVVCCITRMRRSSSRPAIAFSGHNKSPAALAIQLASDSDAQQHRKSKVNLG